MTDEQNGGLNQAMIQNTANFPALHHLTLAAMDSNSYITAMEARGQAEFIASSQFPTQVMGGTDEDLTELGFNLGAQSPGDPLFRQATLPEGWKKVPADHAMWSWIEDQDGNRRVGVFYKAAPYDRRAKATIVSPESQVEEVLDGAREPKVSEWIPAALWVHLLEKARDRELAEAERYLAMPGQDATAHGFARECRERAALASRHIAALGQA